MILFLHSRYRTTGGEERAVADLLWLVREHLGEDAELLERDSAALGRARAAAGLLRGGLAPDDVGAAVRRTGARVVHAHNLNPTLGWRALAAARAAGARTVLHLHNYRLVCAVGTCFTAGADCTRCHGRDTRPGVRLNCRGAGAEGGTESAGSAGASARIDARAGGNAGAGPEAVASPGLAVGMSPPATGATRPGAEALVYAASLAAWQRRLVAHADAVVVPSAFARDRLLALGAPLQGTPVHVVGHVVRAVVQRSTAAAGTYALVAGRLAPEKGVDVAIAACAAAQIELVVAGDGPQESALRALAAGTATRFAGRVSSEELAELRAGAALALAPSRSAETFGLAAAEAMAAGLPVAGSAIGALPELCGPGGLVAAGDAPALAVAAAARFGDERAGEEGRRRIAERAAPAVVAPALRSVYDG